MKPHSEVTMNAEVGLAIIHRYGDMSLEQMIAGVDALFSDPEFQNTTNVISDLTKASLKVTSAEMSKHADFCKEKFAGSTSKIVIIAPSLVDYGMSRMFEILSDLPNVRVVKSHAEAYMWLGIPYEG